LTVHISKAQTFRNVIYSSLMKGTVLVCQLLASTVVARNLSVADVGVVGFANVIIGFLAHFGDCGVGNAAIRRPQLTQRNLETAFTLKVILGAGAFGAAMLLAPFAWHFCNHPAAANVTRFLALNFLVSTIGFLPLVQLTREMNFKALVIPGVINAVVRASLAVTLIFCGWKFWAVVVADVGANLAGGIATQCVRKIRLRFRFDREDAEELLRFGLPLMGSGLLVFLIFNAANFLVSASMGIAQLGYYTLAFNWGSFVCSLLGDTVVSVLFPTFAAIQNDIAKLRRWYLKTVDLVTFISIVANTALLANAHSFLVIFLGKGTDKWMPAAAAMQILCFYGIVRAMTEPIGNCLMVRGQTKILLRAALLCGAVQILLLVLALHAKKIEWVAVSVLVSYASQALIYVPFLRRELHVTFADLLRQLWPAAPAMAAGWWATHALFTADGGSLLTLAGRGLFTAAVVALTHGALTRFRCFRETGELLFQKLSGNMPKEKLPNSI
jgi:O-antigen/teichoic acid export membrane protein